MRLASILLLVLLPSSGESASAALDTETLIRLYQSDHASLRRFYDLPLDPEARGRLRSFNEEWRERLGSIDRDSLDLARRIDMLLLESHVTHEIALLARQAEDAEAILPLLPYAEEILDLERDRRSGHAQDAQSAAEILDTIRAAAGDALEEIEGAEEKPQPHIALRAGRVAGRLSAALAAWHAHHADFVPGFSWWTQAPYDAAKEAVDAHAKHLREEVAGIKGEDDDPLVGHPIGKEALEEALAHEMIPYSAEEILALGERELAWGEERMAEAAFALGFGEDWTAALEHVKGLIVPPGEQGNLVSSQAREAIAFLDERHLVTIPPLARETWRLEMIGSRAQRNFPFAYYGGQSMGVAYATSDMDHETKRQSMRGNNRHFTRNVTPHELIPGHHLQRFVAARSNTHRSLFGTPFLTEGWALYWELRFWDLGWARGPEDEIGMLFWRNHRAARIIVSLKYHLGETSPEEMVDFLVDRVGHERENATAEVRRYISGGYGPLYQAGYLVGGLQLASLHHDLVTKGDWSESAFHDTVLAQGTIPVAMVRASLTGALDPWLFDGG